VCCRLQPAWRHRHPGGSGDVDIGCGIGLLTVQLALNGATHVCAIDLEKHTVANGWRAPSPTGSLIGGQPRAPTFTRGLPRSAKR
jgi:SAM-dependent methyltransferase